MSKMVWGIVGLMVLVAFIPTMTARASTTERNWMTQGQDYNVSGYSVIFNEWLKVSAFDNITFNLKSGDPQDSNYNIYIFTDIIAINYSNISESVNTWQPQYNCYGYWQYMAHFNSAPPQSFWITPSGYGIFQVKVDAYSTSISQQTFNFTITSSQDNINTKIDNLTSQISALDYIIYNMTTNIYNITTNISKIATQISDIYADIYNLSMWESSDISMVRDRINQVNDSLTQMIENLDLLSAQNDSELVRSIDGVVVNFSQIIDGLNSTLNDRISNIPTYNDTSVWNELNNLSQVQPVVEINNTTIINQTLLTLKNDTYVNQTLINQTPITHTYTNKTQTLSMDSTLAVGGAIVAGVISGVISSVVINKFMNRRKLREIPPPEP